MMPELPSSRLLSDILSHLGVPKLDQHLVIDLLQELEQTTTVVLKGKQEGNKATWLHVDLMPLSRSGIICQGQNIVQIRDVTTQRETENRLVEALNETERLLAHISALLIGIDHTGVITRWNKAAEAYLGLNSAVAIGTSFDQLALDWDMDAVAGLMRPGINANKRLCEVTITKQAKKDLCK